MNFKIVVVFVIPKRAYLNYLYRFENMDFNYTKAKKTAKLAVIVFVRRILNLPEHGMCQYLPERSFGIWLAMASALSETAAN